MRNAILIHVTLIPYLKASGELKPKPTQAGKRPAGYGNLAGYPGMPQRASVR